MPIPEYSNGDVLPPFIGETPGVAGDFMSPYLATSLEVVERFAGTWERVDILRGWLTHRAALRNLGFAHGFQWLDGSFLEDKVPHDIDAVTFLRLGSPSFADVETAWGARDANLNLFHRAMVKAVFKVDAFFIDLLDDPETVVGTSRFFFGLFSHQRETFVWKGMLQVRLEDDNGDAAALLRLRELEQTLAPREVVAESRSLFEGEVDYGAS